MCQQWEGLGVTRAELKPGVVVMVPVGQLASVFVNPGDVYWLDVHAGPGVSLPQMYRAKQILGVPALGLTMAGAANRQDGETA